MLFAIMATDVADSLEARIAARPAHIERLNALQSAGRLVLAGPHPQPDRSRVRLTRRRAHLGRG